MYFATKYANEFVRVAKENTDPCDTNELRTYPPLLSDCLLAHPIRKDRMRGNQRQDCVFFLECPFRLL